MVAVGNMIEVGKETGEPMKDTKVMDVCQALIIKANKAHEMEIIKTYDHAVQEYEDNDRSLIAALYKHKNKR